MTYTLGLIAILAMHYAGCTLTWAQVSEPAVDWKDYIKNCESLCLAKFAYTTSNFRALETLSGKPMTGDLLTLDLNEAYIDTRIENPSITAKDRDYVLCIKEVTPFSGRLRPYKGDAGIVPATEATLIHLTEQLKLYGEKR